MYAKIISEVIFNVADSKWQNFKMAAEYGGHILFLEKKMLHSKIRTTKLEIFNRSESIRIIQKVS